MTTPTAPTGLPAVGDEAPAFTLPDQHGTPVSLADFHGEKAVVLVFYPLTFTNVCRGELTAIKADLARYQNDAVQVLAVSVDSFVTHRVWSEEQGYDFPILADFWPHGAVARAYGVFDEAMGVALRGTFVIDRDGRVRWSVVNQIPDARDSDAYAKVLAELA